jgi:hypothetical protein
MPPVRLAPDTWQRGRRARVRARLTTLSAGLAVVVLVAALVGLTVVAPGGRAERAAGGDRGGPGDAGAVPAALDLPWMWQATVQDDPPGRARVLFGGSAQFGLHGTDLVDSEGKLAVVGAGRTTRMLLYGGVDTITAGEDVLLSPDGARVAQGFLENSGTSDDGLVVTDLATGRSVAYPGTQGTGCCEPVAWAPDGRALLAMQLRDDVVYDATGLGMQPARYVWLDLTTGATTPLGGYTNSQGRRTASRGAVAPDGASLVLSEGTTLRMLTTGGAPLWSVDLGPRRYLAGIGAFTPDGARVATVTLDGCLTGCTKAQLAARRWSVGYLDARTGADVAGPALPVVAGSALRALGWTNGRDLVALAYSPYEARPADNSAWNDTGWVETSHVTLLALRPDGTTATLLDPPDGVLNLDVPHDLLAAGRFGGPASHAAMFPARLLFWVPAVLLVVLLAAASAATTMVVRTLRRRMRPRIR